ncbi:aldose 1-epimerase [Luteibacter rhizovicinus]|uniref:Aldose 1-epimerase n=1 Tax=Luteibacter rhizovicinus TaxID=242606 RepID=A0A4R3YJ24_9GAMM|nr:aldose epimerase [Luteibacter rhizovicinus]TCV92427.1 aldose 1-epimerase [Luteibacter rhizovicinus]
MSRFTTGHASLGDEPLLVLVDADGDRSVRIARRGATVLAIELPVGPRLRNIADGFRDPQELATQKGSRFAIMTPFANRVADARYTFEGNTYDLAPGAEGADRAIRHGFLRNVVFDVQREYADDKSASVTLVSHSIRLGTHAGYPFAIDIAVTFTLDDSGLTVEAKTRNVGDHPAPTFFGWHPYFRLSDGPIAEWELTIPADTLIATDADYIPLPGTRAWQALDKADRSFDFRTPRAIGDIELNHTYADLRLDTDGRARTRLRDPKTGVSIAVWQEHGVMLAFTADTVNRDARRAVALEPMECMADAFNRDDCKPLVTLAPGDERRFVCGVEFRA